MWWLAECLETKARNRIRKERHCNIKSYLDASMPLLLHSINERVESRGMHDCCDNDNRQQQQQQHCIIIQIASLLPLLDGSLWFVQCLICLLVLLLLLDNNLDRQLLVVSLVERIWYSSSRDSVTRRFCVPKTIFIREIWWRNEIKSWKTDLTIPGICESEF